MLSMDAARLQIVDLFDERSAGVVVSGLPVLSMPPRTVIATLIGAFRNMKTDGAFYQFTYGPRCPVPPRFLDYLGLKAERSGRTSSNLPPAAVYRIRCKHPPLSTRSRRSSRQSMLVLQMPSAADCFAARREDQ